MELTAEFNKDYSARKLNELGVVDESLDGPQPVEESPRALSAAELTAHEDRPNDRGLSGRGALGDEERPRPDAASEPVGFGGRAIPDQDDRRERWP